MQVTKQSQLSVLLTSVISSHGPFYELPPTWFDALDWTAALTGIAKVPPKDGGTIPMKKQSKQPISFSFSIEALSFHEAKNEQTNLGGG